MATLFILTASAGTGSVIVSKRPLFSTDEAGLAFTDGGHGFYAPDFVKQDSSTIVNRITCGFGWLEVTPDSHGAVVIETIGAQGVARDIFYPGTRKIVQGGRSFEIVGVSGSGEASLRVLAGAASELPLIRQRVDSCHSPLFVRNVPGIISRESVAYTYQTPLGTTGQPISNTNTITLLPPGARYVGGYAYCPTSSNTFAVDVFLCTNFTPSIPLLNMGVFSSSSITGTKLIGTIEGVAAAGAGVKIALDSGDFGGVQTLRYRVRGAVGNWGTVPMLYTSFNVEGRE